MKKLNITDLADTNKLSAEEKRSILGGNSGAFDLKLSGSGLDDVRRARRVRALREVREQGLRKTSTVREFGSGSKGGGTNI